ncbi:MAG: hypothetical protein V1859_01065 [archaeon]
MVKKSALKKEKFIMICPKCKSPDVDMDKTNPVQPAIGLPSMYLCHKCGHTGYAFPEIPVSDLEAFTEDAKKEGIIDETPDKTPKVDVNYGIFEVKVIWKITGPLLLVVGVILLFKQPIPGAMLLSIGASMVYLTYIKK